MPSPFQEKFFGNARKVTGFISNPIQSLLRKTAPTIPDNIKNVAGFAVSPRAAGLASMAGYATQIPTALSTAGLVNTGINAADQLFEYGQKGIPQTLQDFGKILAEHNFQNSFLNAADKTLTVAGRPLISVPYGVQKGYLAIAPSLEYKPGLHFNGERGATMLAKKAAEKPVIVHFPIPSKKRPNEQRYDIHLKGKNVAFLTHYKTDPDQANWITNIETTKKYRGKGYATRLMKRFAKDHAGQKLMLGVGPHKDKPMDKNELIAFYRKMGYKILRPIEKPKYLRYPRGVFMKKKADWTEWDLKEHQKRVMRRMADPKTTGLVVAHGMGSGKTLSSIATANRLKMPTTVVPPAALVGNYEKEIGKWLGTQPKNLNIESQQRAALKGLQNDPKNGLLIVDEAHKAREGTSKLLASLKDSEAKKRMLLTGTPIYNHPKDLSTLVNFVARKRLLPENAGEFNKQYVDQVPVNPSFLQRLMGVKPGIDYKIKNRDKLKRILNQYVDYHPSAQEGFPQVNQEEVKVPMGTKQMDIYKSIMGQAPWWVRWKVKSGLPPGKGELDTMRAFLSGIRQVSNTTHGFTTRKNELESPKLEHAFGYLQNQLQRDPTYKAVVYSNYIGSGLNPYKELLTKNNVPYGEFSGNISPAVRNQLVRDYNANKLKALLISSAGAEGLDLKGTRLVQILEPHFNEQKENQIIGRGARYLSHAALPANKQNMLVQRYLAQPKAGFLDKILGHPEVKGADEYIRAMAARKDALNKQVSALMNPNEKKRGGLWYGAISG